MKGQPLNLSNLSGREGGPCPRSIWENTPLTLDRFSAISIECQLTERGQGPPSLPERFLKLSD